MDGWMKREETFFFWYRKVLTLLLVLRSMSSFADSPLAWFLHTICTVAPVCVCVCVCVCICTCFCVYNVHASKQTV